MPMVNKPNKIDYLCPKCGSNNVTSDATAAWDVESQTWMLEAVFDSMSCGDCKYDSNHGFDASLYKEAPLSQDSVEAYDKDVANGFPAGRHPKYENGVMIPTPMIELLKEGQVIDTSEFSDEIPD